jgi:hypothetical protein
MAATGVFFLLQTVKWLLNYFIEMYLCTPMWWKAYLWRSHVLFVICIDWCPIWIWIWILVFNVTFSNISAISCRPVLVVDEARVLGENQSLKIPEKVNRSQKFKDRQYKVSSFCFTSGTRHVVTFSNISAISCRPVLVVDEARVLGENHRPWASNW